MRKDQQKDRDKSSDRTAPKGRDWRDHPVEEEADRDIKEGGIEQTGHRDKTGG